MALKAATFSMEKDGRRHVLAPTCTSLLRHADSICIAFVQRHGFDTVYSILTSSDTNRPTAQSSPRPVAHLHYPRPTAWHLRLSSNLDPGTAAAPDARNFL